MGAAAPLKELAERAEADGRGADAARLYWDAITVYERRRRQRAADVDLIDFEAGPRPLRDLVDPAVLPMPPGKTWALCQLVALLDGTEGSPAGDAVLRELADAGNPWALERLLRRLHERGLAQEAEVLLVGEAARDNPWALWVQARRAVHDEQVADKVCRALLERAAAARMGQAVRMLMQRAEQSGQTGEADQWVLHAAARGYTPPLWELVRSREQVGRLEEAEQLAWRAPDGLRSWMLRRLAQGRAAEQGVVAAGLRRVLGVSAAPARRTSGRGRRARTSRTLRTARRRRRRPAGAGGSGRTAQGRRSRPAVADHAGERLDGRGHSCSFVVTCSGPSR